MPTHLERICVAIDPDLEKWEITHESEYNVSKAFGLETCKAKGQETALRKLRQNTVNAQFPEVSLPWLHFKGG
jgi:hypothetical protein